MPYQHSIHALQIAYLGFCGVVGKLRLLPSVLARKLMHIGNPGNAAFRPLSRLLNLC